MARAWFAYLGTGNTANPSNYLLSANPPTCINGRAVCAVYALYNPGSTLPSSISQNLQVYIGTGRATGLPQPALPVGSKKYVYFLPIPSPN